MGFWSEFDPKDAAFIMGIIAMIALILAAAAAIAVPAASESSIFQMVVGQFIGLLNAAIIFFFKGDQKPPAAVEEKPDAEQEKPQG